MKYILEGREPRLMENVLEWARRLESTDRCVMQTRLIDGSVISTVFLGVDHGWQAETAPVLFETALLTEDGVSVCARYCTWAEAETGHMEWIEHCVPSEMIETTTRHQEGA